MIRIITFIVCFLSLQGCCDAGTDTLTLAQWHSTTMTVEELLGVPPVYTVLNCSIRAVHPQYGVLLLLYCRDSQGGCATVGASGFPAMWQTLLHDLLMRHYTLTLSDIEMQRADRIMHWQQKHMIAP